MFRQSSAIFGELLDPSELLISCSITLKKSCRLWDPCGKVLQSLSAHTWQYNTTHALCMLDTLGYRHTLRIYRVIHKSLRDFRPLRYSSRDGHAEGEHVNRGRDPPSFCPTLQVLDMCTLGDATDVKFWQFPRHRQLTYSLSTPCFVTTAPLAVKPASTPRRLVPKNKLGEIRCLLICSFLPCLSWLLRSGVRKSRRDLWITLYNT
jgi:hypothetical protein